MASAHHKLNDIGTLLDNYKTEVIDRVSHRLYIFFVSFLNLQLFVINYTFGKHFSVYDDQVIK